MPGGYICECLEGYMFDENQIGAKRRKRRETDGLLGRVWMGIERTTTRPRRQPTTRRTTTTTTTTTTTRDTEGLTCPDGFQLFSWGSSETCMKSFGKGWLSQAHTKCSSGSELPLPASAEEQLRRGSHICKPFCREEASGWNFNTLILIAKLELRVSNVSSIWNTYFQKLSDTFWGHSRTQLPKVSNRSRKSKKSMGYFLDTVLGHIWLNIWLILIRWSKMVSKVGRFS